MRARPYLQPRKHLLPQDAIGVLVERGLRRPGGFVDPIAVANADQTYRDACKRVRDLREAEREIFDALAPTWTGTLAELFETAVTA